MNNNRSGFVAILLVVLVAIAAVGGGIWFAQTHGKIQNKVVENPAPVVASTTSTSSVEVATTPSSQPQPATSTAKTPSPVIQIGGSIDDLRIAFEKLKAAKDEASVKALLSKASLVQAQGATFGAGTTANMTLVSLARTGPNLTTGVVRVGVPNEGSGTNEQNIYFVFEDGQWKLDLPKTISALLEEAAHAQNNPPAAIQPGQTVNLAVIGFEADPSGAGQPRYSDPEAVVRAKVKNNGTATISKIEYEYKINTYSSPGTWLLELKPGQVTTLPLRLSPGYKFFAQSHPEYQQGAGNYAFSIELDHSHILPDTNRADNSGSKVIYFYP